MTNKTTTTINFKDLPKEIKVCLDSVHDDFKTKVKMSDFTKFPDIESFSEDNLIKHKNYWTSDLNLSPNIYGTRFECHEKLDLFLDELSVKYQATKTPVETLHFVSKSLNKVMMVLMRSLLSTMNDQKHKKNMMDDKIKLLKQRNFKNSCLNLRKC